MLNLAMLCALNRSSELAVHVRGAIKNGVSKKEMSEVFVQVCVYAGMPAGMEGTKVAMRVWKEMEEKGEVDAEGNFLEVPGAEAGVGSGVSTPGLKAGYAFYMP